MKQIITVLLLFLTACTYNGGLSKSELKLEEEQNNKYNLNRSSQAAPLATVGANTKLHFYPF